MDDFGFDEKDPLKKNTDDNDDDDGGNIASGSNETTGFKPGYSSTPAQRQTTLNRPREQASYSELPEPPGLSTTNYAKEELNKEFPNFVENKIKYMKVGLVDPKKPYCFLITKIAGKDEYQINPSLTKEVLRDLPEPRRETLEKQIKNLTDGIIANKEAAEDSSASLTERNKAHAIAKTQINKRTALTRELDEFKKGKYFQPLKSIELEEFQTNDEERQQREQEIQREIQEQEEIVNDEKRPSVQREHAKENKRELEQEQNEIENEREREISRTASAEIGSEREGESHLQKIRLHRYSCFAGGRYYSRCYSQLALKRPERSCQRRWKRS